MSLKFITAEQAAEFIHHNDNVGFSGFTPAGSPKVVAGAIAAKAEAEEAAKAAALQAIEKAKADKTKAEETSTNELLVEIINLLNK